MITKKQMVSFIPIKLRSKNINTYDAMLRVTDSKYLLVFHYRVWKN